MIIIALILLGLCLGSFVNALVWRVREQSGESKVQSRKSKVESLKSKAEGRKSKVESSKASANDLSILKGRSMCPHCKHELAAMDLLPLISWLSLRGKCRYCGQSISKQYPLVEAATAVLFVASYIWWPQPFDTSNTILFSIWLLVLTGLMALLVYDLRWYLLPDRILFPTAYLAGAFALVGAISSDQPLRQLISTLLAVIVGGGIFYVIFQVSQGKWIGGGDVKLGWLLGLVVGSPAKAILFIFLAALMGSLVSVPLLASKKLKKSSIIPFGPFLILAAIIVLLFGQIILDWYKATFLPYV